MLRSKTALSVTRMLGAAVGQNAPHFGQRELRIQRNRDAAGADDGQKPVEAALIVGAIDGDRLPRAQTHTAAQEGIDRADDRVQFGEMEGPVLVDRNLAIALPPQQFVHQVGDGDACGRERDCIGVMRFIGR